MHGTRGLVQLAAGLGGFLGQPGVDIGGVGDAGDLPGDVLGHMSLLFGRDGHLLAHVVDQFDGIADFL